MFKKSEMPVSRSYFLKPGYILIPKKPTVISVVLGSCVAVSISDKKKKISGINHFLLPYTKDSSKSTARYGNVATLALLKMMIEEGSKTKNLEAQIFGGAHNPEISRENIGWENIRIARKVLSRKGIKIVSEDVGGEKGRKIIFDTAKNELAVLKVDNLRKGDWYPYEDDR